MIAAVLDPNLLFADEVRWKDESYKDDFIERLLDHLEALENVPGSRLLWSDNLEADLWTSPNVPPWRAERDLAIPMVPIVINRLRKLHQLIYEHIDMPLAKLDPALIAPPSKPNTMTETQHIISYCIITCLSWNIVLAPSNAHAAPCLRVEVHQHGMTELRPIVSPCDWAGVEEVRDMCWPKRTLDDQRRFRTLIGWFTKRYFEGLANSASQSEYKNSRMNSSVRYKDIPTDAKLFAAQSENASLLGDCDLPTTLDCTMRQSMAVGNVNSVYREAAASIILASKASLSSPVITAKVNTMTDFRRR